MDPELSGMLTYCDSEVEIRLGDRVTLKGLLWGARQGIVCYVPGACAPHPEFEIDGLSYWAIQLEDGTLISWPYLPQQLKASKRLKFKERGDPGSALIDPSEELQ